MPTDILGVIKSEDPIAHMERKVSEINMRKKINGRWIAPSDLKTHNKISIIKVLWYWHMKR